MNFLNGVAAEFRRRRLWPVALILLAAIVAVPVLLSRQPAAAQVPPPSQHPLAGAGVPVLSVSSGPSNTLLKGHERDPFAGNATTTATTAVSAAAARVASAASSGSPAKSSGGAPSSPARSSAASNGTPAAAAPSASSNSTGSSFSAPSLPSSPAPAGSGSSGSSGTPTTATPPPADKAPASAPAGAPATLGPRQSYHVALSVTDGSGGVRSLDPVKRLTLLPSAVQPRAIELGVLQGGKQVLFAALPGAVASGDGNCTPSTEDCQLFALGQDQVETFTVGGGQNATVVAQLSVTGITADRHPTKAAATRARKAFSPAGQKELGSVQLDALSLFEYRPALGALVNLDDLTVGS